MKSFARNLLTHFDPRLGDRLFLLFLWSFSMAAIKLWQHAEAVEPSSVETFRYTIDYVSPSSVIGESLPEPADLETPSQVHSMPLSRVQWAPYLSDSMDAVLTQLGSDSQPTLQQVQDAYLDIDVEALRRYESISSEQAAILRQQLDAELQRLGSLLIPEEESGDQFLGRINREVHRRQGLRYQSDQNTVASFLHNDRLQCRSASILVMLLWLQHADQFSDMEPVFVLSAKPVGHMQPGLVAHSRLRLTEATAKSGRVDSLMLRELKGVHLVHAREYLLSLVAKGAGAGELVADADVSYHRSEPLRDWKDTEIQQPENPTPAAFPLSVMAMGRQSLPFTEQDFVDDSDPSLGLGLFDGLGDIELTFPQEISSVVDGSSHLFRIEPEEVSGALDPQKADVVMEGNSAKLSRCLRDIGSRFGFNQITVRLWIQSDGRLREARVLYSTHPSESLLGCLQKRLLRLRFPAASGETVVTAVLHF